MSILKARVTVTKTVKAIVPFDRFERIFTDLPKDRICRLKWCSFSRTTCHVRKVREELRAWWKETNGNARGFSHYEAVLQNSINCENKLYWAFWTHEMQPCRKCYDELVSQVRLAFEGKPVDTNGFFGHQDAWPPDTRSEAYPGRA